MPTKPIHARCGQCGETFALFELRDRRTGNCPRCMRQLAPDWTQKLLHDAVRAEVALSRLVESLRALQKLPTSMQVLPSSVLRSLLEETGWDEQLATNPDLSAEELSEIRSLVARWERRAGRVGERHEPRRRAFRFGRRDRDALASAAPARS